MSKVIDITNKKTKKKPILLEYKGYYCSVSDEIHNKLWLGKIENIKHLIIVEGRTLDELELDFANAVDQYLIKPLIKVIKVESRDE